MTDNWFKADSQKMVGKVTGLSLVPCSIKIDDVETIEDRFVIEVDDLSGRRADPYTYRFKPSKHRNSKWQRWLAAARKTAGVHIESEDDIVGQYALFSFNTYEWGEQFSAENVPDIVQLFESEDDAIAYMDENGIWRAGADEDGEQDYLRDLILLGIDGLQHDAFVTKVLLDPEYADVNANTEIRKQVISGDYFVPFIQDGTLTIDENGAYHYNAE